MSFANLENELMRTSKIVFCLCIFLLFAVTFPNHMQMKILCAGEPIWYVHDVIDASLDEVKWTEEGGTTEAVAWITDGLWYAAWMRQSLVGVNDIFVETYESFNWSRIKNIVDYYYGITFNTFYEFASFIENSPSQWLDISWQIDTEWYGVHPNTTKIKYSFNETTANAEIWTWFHITRIPEYFAGEGRMENWLTGFDLTPVSTGNLKMWEFHKKWSISGVWYSLGFKALASILSQHLTNYTLTINFLPEYQGRNNNIQRVIDINMPANSDVKEATPSNMCIINGNTATFVIGKDEKYPSAFTVISGPPTKSLSQTLWEGASLWLFTPGGWATMASITVLSFTALRGRRILNRNKLYHRLYKSIVTIYDMYVGDTLKFHQEMDKLSRSIFTMLVQDRITEEQFEKLLQRRDDLIKRTQYQ